MKPESFKAGALILVGRILIKLGVNCVEISLIFISLIFIFYGEVKNSHRSII